MKHIVKFGCAVVGPLLLAGLVTGCGEIIGKQGGGQAKPPTLGATKAPDETDLRPKPRPDGAAVVAKPAQTAHTAEQFDTTTSSQRADAIVEVPQSGERRLGETIGSLGNPAEPGFWLKTPLVSAAAKGRVEYAGTGKSVAVDLIPIDGPKTAGSRVALAVLRLLGAPLTGLPTLIVFRE